MLQSIREKSSGWLATVILGLIILTMAFFGIESYLTQKVETFTAKIEGPAKFMGLGKQSKEISQDDFRRRFDQVRQEQRKSKGDAFNPAEFEKVENKRAVLDQLVDESLITLAAERDGIVIPNSEVKKQILAISEFKADGKFDPNQYRLVLQMQGYTPQVFEQLVRDGLIKQAFPNEISASGLSSDAEINDYLRLSKQTRDIRVLDIPAASITDAVPSDADVKAWYDSHIDRYRSEETVAIEYVELDASNMAVSTTPDDNALRELYVREKQKFGTSEQRFASHILVKVDEKATPAAVAAALAKAKDIAAKAKAPGADFAGLARQYSEDPGSKDAGGDLGPVDKGVFGDEFDKAFFALEPGQVSDPVRLPDGWHIIQYRELRAGTMKSFDDVKDQLTAEYLESEREREFNDVSGKLVDKVYADPSVLAPAAKALGLTVYKTDTFTRNHGSGIAALEPVRKAAFNNAQKIDRQVSDPVEISPNHVVVLHVIDYKPAAPIALAEVHDRVLSDLNADRLEKASKKRADELLARAQKGDSLEAIGADIGRTVAVHEKLDRFARDPQLAPLSEQAFRMPRPTEGKPDVGLAKLGGDRYALVQVVTVSDGNPDDVDAATRKTLREQLTQARGAMEARDYIKGLRKFYKITVAEDRL